MSKAHIAISTVMSALLLLAITLGHNLLSFSWLEMSILIFVFFVSVVLDFFLIFAYKYSGPSLAREGAAKHFNIATDFVSLLLPKRLVKEDLGDAKEEVQRLVAQGAHPYKIYIKLASCLFWLLINTARELLSVLSLRSTK